MLNNPWHCLFQTTLEQPLPSGSLMCLTPSLLSLNALLPLLLGPACGSALNAILITVGYMHQCAAQLTPTCTHMHIRTQHECNSHPQLTRMCLLGPGLLRSRRMPALHHLQQTAAHSSTQASHHCWLVDQACSLNGKHTVAVQPSTPA